MTKKIVWRLANRPTPQEIVDLVSSGILAKEEAREILFTKEEDDISSKKDSRDTESLESEIKFLRDLVQKLSSGSNTKIVEVIREVYKPYQQYYWYKPYEAWCSGSLTSAMGQTSVSNGTANAMYTVSNVNGATGSNYTMSITPADFSKIKTF